MALLKEGRATENNRMLKEFIKNTNFGISLLFVSLSILLALIILPIFGKKAFIVRTGSMSPLIKAGDLVVTTPASVYRIGNIIAFHDIQNPKTIITHRIVDLETRDNQIFYKTKGDANNTPDINLVLQKNIIGQGVMGFPYLGKVFAFARSRQGFPLMVIFPSLIVIFSELANIFREIFSNKNKSYIKKYVYKKSRKGFRFKLLNFNEL